MFVASLVCFLVLGISLDVLSIWMKMRVNEALPQDRHLTWWSRNYRQVERIYGEQHPDSVLPDLSRYGGYLTMALFVAMILVGIIQRD
jgi:hypothetical protein